MSAQIFMWLLTAVSILAFALLFLLERRLLINAFLLGATVVLALISTSLTILSLPFGVVIFLLVSYISFGLLLWFSWVLFRNGIVTIKNEGFSISHCIAPLFSCFIWLLLLLGLATVFGLVDRSISGLIMPYAGFAGMYMLFTLLSLLLYSYIYRIAPPGKRFDFIIVLGCGLIRGEEISPLLQSRLDRAYKIWLRDGQIATIITSGGKGSDEELSEASAMRDYLVRKGVPPTKIVPEERSATTEENMVFSRQLIEDISSIKDPNCVFVTNDFHVLRASLYARKAGLKAEGVGSRTKRWYWFSAFMREYAAIMIKYSNVGIVILVIWALVLLARLI